MGWFVGSAGYVLIQGIALWVNFPLAQNMKQPDTWYTSNRTGPQAMGRDSSQQKGLGVPHFSFLLSSPGSQFMPGPACWVLILKMGSQNPWNSCLWPFLQLSLVQCSAFRRGRELWELIACDFFHWRLSLILMGDSCPYPKGYWAQCYRRG